MRSISLPMPMQKSEPTSVATRLICANATRLICRSSQERLGDEAETLGTAWQRADHRKGGHAEYDPPVIEALATDSIDVDSRFRHAVSQGRPISCRF